MLRAELRARAVQNRLRDQTVITCRVRGVLLDIEGTTSSIAFVHDVMFPFVRQHLQAYVAQRWQTAELQAALEHVARDAGAPSWAAWMATQSASDPQAALIAHIHALMDRDVKATGLKQLQGLIWDSGFRSGALQADVYADVLPAIAAWRQRGIDVRIYSSGSVAAQRLFFGHVAGQGNCLSLFSGHYDTTIGSKREAASYSRIADDWGLQPKQILFVSDLAAELDAALAAGLQVVASVRPGNAALPDLRNWPTLNSFAELALELDP